MLILCTGTYNIWERVTCFIDWLNLCKRPCLKIKYVHIGVCEREKERKREYMKLKSLRSFPELF